MDKNKLYNNIYLDLYDSFISTYYLYKDIDDAKRVQYDLEIRRIINDLLDSTKKAIIPLDRVSTYVLRKRYGVIDFQNEEIKYISINQKLSMKEFYKILKDVKRKLDRRILYCTSQKKLNKLSSLELSDKYDELKDRSIDEMNLNSIVFNKLTTVGINTFEDLLTLGFKDLSSILGLSKSFFDEVVTKTHSLDLRFIDDLTELEKINYILSNSEEKILNSSVCWIDTSKLEDEEQEYIHNELKTIGRLKKDMELASTVTSEQLTKEVKKIGLNVNAANIYRQNIDLREDFNYMSLEDILNTSITSFSIIAPHNKKVLHRKNVYSIKDLVKLNTTDLKPLFSFISYPIIKVIHNSGLVFNDEIKNLKIYSNAISEQLQENKSNKQKKLVN